MKTDNLYAGDNLEKTPVQCLKIVEDSKRELRLALDRIETAKMELKWIVEHWDQYGPAHIRRKLNAIREEIL